MRLLLLSLAIVLISCAPREVREAQEVVVLADSLREAHLVAQDEYNDSTHLAQAYYTLEKWQWLYPDDFAHACYHYGRILRDKDDPVSAMQVFLAATHSRTHDYHILGRVYSNIGDICRLGENHNLAFTMYQQTSNCFCVCGDSLLYNYGLNEMAFELAIQGKRIETLALLDSIRYHCSNINVFAKTLETEALLYQTLKQYDSVVVLIDSLQTMSYSDVFGLTMKARAFEYLENKDSSTFYAQKVVSLSNTNTCSIAAYYIISHNDSSLTIDSLLSITSARIDVLKTWAASKGTLSQAVQLLEQDLARQPDRRWQYAIIATILILGIVNGCIVYKKRKRHQLLSQQIEDLESKNEIQIDQMKAQMEDRCSAITNSPNLKEELDWHDYDHMCAIVNLRLFGILNHLQSYSLSEKETRLCILVLLKANTSQMVDMIPYAQSGLGKFKYSTARKLGTTTANMRSFLLNLVCS